MSKENKSREQFEEWAKSEGFSVARGMPKHCVNTIYTDGETYSLWQAWQASRAALVVELPPISDIETDYSDQGYNICHRSVLEKLKDQGLKFHIHGDIIWAEENGDING